MQREDVKQYDIGIKAQRPGTGRIDLREPVDWEGSVCVTIAKSNPGYWLNRQQRIAAHARRIRRRLRIT